MEEEREFGKSVLDKEFRRKMKQLIDSAEEEILVITGEAGAFEYFQDLRWAIQRAVKRGVSVKVFATSPKQSTVNKMINSGCEVWIGEKELKGHYTIIDGRITVTSREHQPRKWGVRQGTIKYSGAEKFKKLFKEYTKEGEKAKIKDEEDPLVKIIEKPLDLGFETDSSQIDRYI